jgi:octaprenyl-diphosphate synthase
MTEAVQRGVSLQAIQLPVRAKLDDVSRAMAAIVASKMPLVGQVSAHLLAMRGKLFRPTLLLLSSMVDEEDGRGSPRLRKP